MAFPLIKHLIADNKKTVRNKKKPAIKLIDKQLDNSLVLDSDEIENILLKTEKNHALLTVEINENKNLHSSLILEVNTRQNYLVIDEFCPKQVNQSIAKGDKLDINCNYSGSSLRFLSEVLDSSEHNGNPYYKIVFPDVVEYSQRRQAHRVPVSISSNMKVTFTTENGSLMHGLIRDLSHGGFCARLNPPLVERFKPNDSIPKCIIQMPDNSIIVCSTDVRRMFLSTSTGIPMIGCRFAEMNAIDRKTLQQNIAKLERDLMKQIKRTA